MKIDLYIDGQKKTFSTPFVPMLAKRKFLEIQAKEEKMENPTTEEILDLDEEMYSILTDVIFRNQFTLEELYNGAELKYVQDKLSEAVFGRKPKVDVEGNDQGE